MKTLRLWFVSLLLPGAVLAQAGPSASSSSDTAGPDMTWQTLKTYGRPASSLSVNSGKSGKSVRAEQAAKFVDQANQLRGFYTTYPSHASAKEAKWREASALNRAALSGDASQQQRRLQLLDEIRTDASIPEARRFEVAAWAEQVAFKQAKPKGRLAVLEAQEGITRRLIKEFPSVLDGYQSLLGIARDSPPDRAVALLRDLLAMPGATPKIRADAQRLVQRFALVGQKLDSVLGPMRSSVQLGDPAETPVVLYSWRAAVPHSTALAKQLVSGAHGFNIVGICLDVDSAKARQFAATENLPGVQFFDDLGAESPLANALHVGSSIVIYLIDAAGIIRDVQGQHDFASKLSTLGGK